MNNGINNQASYGPIDGSTQNMSIAVSGRPLPSDMPPGTIMVLKVRRIANLITPYVTTPAAKGNAHQTINVIGVRPYSRINRTTTYWQDTGWEDRGGHLIGHYHTPNRLYPGSIEIRDSMVDPWRFYIYGPPATILHGPHSACYRRQGIVGGTPKYWIHFATEPADIDSGIIQIERDLNAARDGR